MKYKQVIINILLVLAKHNQISNEQMDIDSLLGSVSSNGLEPDLLGNLLRILNSKRLIRALFENQEMVAAAITPFGEMYLDQLLKKQEEINL